MIADKYRLGRMLGEGGMGAVYEAVHVDLQKRVALKLLSPQIATNPTSVKRFKREARAAAAVKHDNVVSVTDTGTDDDGVPFIVMELLEGESLSSLLHRERVLPPEIAVPIIMQILGGLGAAHEQGVVHRDLKPPNIFITKAPDGGYRVKILDFGISKFGADQDKASLTADGGLVGTPQFMAPEQVKARKDVDARADIYAVGVLLYRMLSGKLPFRAKKADELYSQILAGTPKAICHLNPSIDAELDTVVLKAMALRREDRYEDARAFRQALHRVMPEMPADGTIPPGAPAEPSDIDEFQTARTMDAVQVSQGTSEGDRTDEDLMTSASARPSTSFARSDATTSPRELRAAGSMAGRSAIEQAPSVDGQLPEKRRVGPLAAVLGILVVLGVAGGLSWQAGLLGDDHSSSDSADGTVDASAEDAEDSDAVGAQQADADGRVADRDALRFGIREYHGEAEMRRRHQPLVEYLTAQTALPFIIVPRDDFVDMAEALANQMFEFASLSALEFVRAEELVPDLIKLGKPVNARGVDSYQAVILSRAGEDLYQLTDLRNRIFCYVSRNSNSGYRYPRVMLHRQGLNPDEDFSDVRFGTEHPRTLEMLRQGECDAASVYMNIWDEAEDKGSFHIMQTSGPIPNEQYVAHPSVSQEDIDAVQQALSRLTEGSPEALRVFGPHPQREYFAPYEASDHDGLRDLLRYERENDIAVHQRNRRVRDREP